MLLLFWAAVYRYFLEFPGKDECINFRGTPVALGIPGDFGEREYSEHFHIFDAAVDRYKISY